MPLHFSFQSWCFGRWIISRLQWLDSNIWEFKCIICCLSLSFTNVLFQIYYIILTLDGAESVDMREIIEDIPTEQEGNPRKRKLSSTEQQQTNVKTSR